MNSLASVNLITTNSYFGVYDILFDIFKIKSKNIDEKNIVFCDEKSTLKAETTIVNAMGGTFNTRVFSFGDFIREKKNIKNTISNEGAVMLLKKILGSIILSCIKNSKKNGVDISSTLYNLIILLKSSKVTPNDIKNSIDSANGILKDKLKDIYTIYNEYEKSLENKFIDSSSELDLLPEFIENDDVIKNSDVYLVGYTFWTKQGVEITKKLMERAKSVTIILTSGQLPAFVNETKKITEIICENFNIKLNEKYVVSNYAPEANVVLDALYNPNQKFTKKQSQNIFEIKAKNRYDEIEKIAFTIKSKILKENYRYKDFAIATNDENYADIIEKVFNDFDIKVFLDNKKSLINHPLSQLTLSYIDFFRNKSKRETLFNIAKNPLVESDRSVADKFVRFMIANNIHYSKLKDEFVDNFENSDDKEKLNCLREKLCSILSKFDIKNLFDTLKVEKHIEDFSLSLIELNEPVISAINSQAYNAITDILTQIDIIFGDTSKLTPVELKTIFKTGIEAKQVSILPQYNDAVYVGDYRSVANYKTPFVFILGLTCDVPAFSQDTSLLSDNDIDLLNSNGFSTLEKKIEPKIQIVNNRLKENIVMALSSFDKGVYLSYPEFCDGSKMEKSEIFIYLNRAFDIKELKVENGILAYKQGLKVFAKECGKLSFDVSHNKKLLSEFYYAIDSEDAKHLCEIINEKETEKLDTAIIDNACEIAPTTIEAFYACPYRTFLEHAIKAKENKKSDMGSNDAGTILHEMLEEYINAFKNELKAKKQITREESDKKVVEIFNDIRQNAQFKKFENDEETSFNMENLLEEGKVYLFKTYNIIIKSDFRNIKTEVKFGDKKDYPAIPLENDYKIHGMIDRVDFFDGENDEKYMRILDYKTGKINSVFANLYVGDKMQLFLYPLAIQETENDRKVAGVYYLKVKEKYSKNDEEEVFSIGKTINDEKIIKKLDNDFENGVSATYSVNTNSKSNSNTVDEIDMQNLSKYALAMSNQAIKELKSGYIKATPIKDSCAYCNFKGICNVEKITERDRPRITNVKKFTDCLNIQNKTTKEEK